MIIRSSSLFGLDHHVMVYLIIAIALILVPASNSAPMYESDQTELENYGESSGCYYNYNHYGEGDRIMTNEPCLNCTCHDRMLMCYLRVCPFTKAIGQDCTIEKREDQCCPVITCPEVEVQLLDHQTTANPSNALGASSSSEVGMPDQYGCSINGRFYPEGAQVPSNPQKPCELCYCIRNMTTCVMQECTLHIDGCQPIYNKGVCCPVKYDCDHDIDSSPMLENESTTTVRPTPGFILTTTVTPSVSSDCVHNGETYADGALIMTDKPCEHCYCMRGDIVCAVQECGTPLENEGKNCTALPPAVGQCCPDKYICDGSVAAMTTTTVPSIPTADVTQEPEEHQSTKTEQDSIPTQTTQASVESSTTMVNIDQKVQDEIPDEKDDTDDDTTDDQQEQEHVAPQFEDVQTDDSHEDDDNDEQVPEKVDDEQRTTTTHPSVSGEPDIESDHIPGHESSHEKDENQPYETTTVVVSDAAAQTTVRLDTQSPADVAEQDETSTETHDDAEVPSDISATTIVPKKDAHEPEADQVPLELDDDEATSTAKSTVDEIASPNEPTTVRNDEDISEAAITTSHPPQLIPLANADENENEIDEHHDKETETSAVDHQPELDDALTSQEDEEQKKHDGQEKLDDNEGFSTTTTLPERDEIFSETDTPAHVPSSDAVKPEQDKPEASTEKKEAAQKADDQPSLQAEQDFVELPPAVVITELPPIPTSSDESSLMEQTPEPPKDEILPNMPLEADSHVLSDSMTTEHAPTFGDRKEDDVQEVEQNHVQPAADMEEPVEMNTIIPLETDELKVEEPVNQENEFANDNEQEHVVEQDQHNREDEQSTEEQDHVTPGHDEVQTNAMPVDEKLKDDQHVVSPDKLFPESIPGEGDCLIDGVTYENGASVPPSGKCQVACHCSNSIVHCEMVRCKAAPSDDCTPKSTLSGECCATYVCPKETTSTASSVSVESNEASMESDAESDEEQQSADVSTESSESSTTAPVSDSQSTSTHEEDDESSQPSEAESDSAGFDLDDEVFKPLRPQEPSLDMSINYFAGNRPTTANYEEDIVSSTAAPTSLPGTVDTVIEGITNHSTKPHKPEQHIPTDATSSVYDMSTTEEKQETTTLGSFAEKGLDSEQDENEVAPHDQDEESLSTTSKTFTADSETTSAPTRYEISPVQSDILEVEVTTSGVEVDNEQRVTSPTAYEEKDNKNQIQDTTHGADNIDDELEIRTTVQDSATSSPTIEEHVDQDDEQHHPFQTTIRPAESTVETATVQDTANQHINDIESDDISSVVEDDDKPSSVADDTNILAQEATTTRAVEVYAEQMTVTAIQQKDVDSTSALFLNTERDDQPATTMPTAAFNELGTEEHAGEKQKDKVEMTNDEILESTAPRTSKPAIETEQTTPYVREAEQKLTTIADEEQTVTTVQAVVSEKVPDVPTQIAVQNAMNEDRDDNRKKTDVTTVSPTMDDSIIFRVDDDEDEPIVKPTLEETIPSQDAVKPFDELKPTQDAVKPQPADREETDDDNLISPEQDGGFHYPQEEDDEAEEAIYKPSLDDSEQPDMSLPVAVPQETVPLEPVDQIKEHDDDGQSTTVRSEDVTNIPSIVKPLKPEQDSEQITHDAAQESNLIESDVHQITTPIKKPEQTPLYDKIEENEQQTVTPSKHYPELTTVAHKQDSEAHPTTEKYHVSTYGHEKLDDEQQQPTTEKSAFEQDEKADDDTADALPGMDNVHPTTIGESPADSAEDEQQKMTTVPTSGAHLQQEQDKQTTSSIPIHDDTQSEEEDVHIQIHLDDNDEDVPVATTPRVTESQDESETENDKVSQFDDQDEIKLEATRTKGTVSYNEVQTTTVGVDVKQTLPSVVTEQSTTLAPVQDVVKDDESTQKTDFDSDSAHTSSEEDDEQEDTYKQKETATKIPVAKPATDASEELISPTEPVTNTDDSSSITEATLKEDQKLEDGDMDEPMHMTLAPHESLDKKQQPELDSYVTTKPTGSEAVVPMEDDVDFEQEQQTVFSTTTPQTSEEKDKHTIAALPHDEDKLPEFLSPEAEKMSVSTEQEVQVTTVRATEFDFNAIHTNQEHPLLEPEYNDDDREEIAHSTTYATPEQAYDAPNRKPAETESDESVSTEETSIAPFEEKAKPDADVPDKDEPLKVPVTTSISIDDEHSQEEDDDGQFTTTRPKPMREEDSPTSTTVDSVPQEPEFDETSVAPRPVDAQDLEQTSETVVANVPESDVATYDKPTAPEAMETATTSEEEHDEVEQPQTDDLNADDDSSEEDDTPIALTTTSTPVKATTISVVSNTPTKDVTSDEVTFKPDDYTTVAPVSDSQVTEQQTTVRHEDAPVSTEVPVSYSNATAITQPAEEASQTTSTPDLNQDGEKEHFEPQNVSQVTVTRTSPINTTTLPTDPKAEEPVREVSTSIPTQDDFPLSTVATVSVQEDKLEETLDDKLNDKQDDRLDEKLDEKPSAPVQDEELAQKPHPAGDDSDEQQAAVKPTFPEDDDDDQQKVQEPEITGQHDDSSASAKPTQQPETVGPSYGAPGQHYDTGYGHMPPHYPPSSYEDDYAEEEDPAAFGPGTCRYGGKLYVSAQQIPRDDPCDFCFCFRSDIICLQQSCPPPISGCNEEPIAGFCCPRYECPVSMATVLNVTTSTTTTTTTLPPHFLSHAYKGHVQKRGCQIQGKPYNVGETVASASGPCMRCTCGGDGQMQCEPKACSPEPMLQQMIAVAAARR